LSDTVCTAVTSFALLQAFEVWERAEESEKSLQARMLEEGETEADLADALEPPKNTIYRILLEQLGPVKKQACIVSYRRTIIAVA
jgi:hypothetical protein